MTAAIEIHGVGKRFGVTNALTNIDATIESGRLTGLVGPDGAGKTTLIRMHPLEDAGPQPTPLCAEGHDEVALEQPRSQLVEGLGRPRIRPQVVGLGGIAGEVVVLVPAVLEKLNEEYSRKPARNQNRGAGEQRRIKAV